MMRLGKNTAPTALHALAAVLLLLSLTNCSLLRNRDAVSDPVAMPQGNASTDTMREACRRACGRDYSVCNEGPASRDEAFDAPKQILGASAACDTTMRDCLRNCH